MCDIMNAKRILTLINILAIATLAASAQAAVSISPSRVEAKVPPGEGFEEKFILKNMSDEPVGVNIQWSNRTPNVIDPEWLKIETDKIMLAPNEVKNVAYTVRIPEGASGEYNAWFSISEDKSAGTVMGADIALRTSIPIYVAVRGTEQFSFTVDTLIIRNKNAGSISLNLRNTGNVHIRPRGVVRLAHKENGIAVDIPFNDGEWGIIAGQSHEYVTKLPDDMSFENGTYTAAISIQAGYDDKVYEFSQTIEFSINGQTCEITRGLPETE